MAVRRMLTSHRRQRLGRAGRRASGFGRTLRDRGPSQANFAERVRGFLARQFELTLQIPNLLTHCVDISRKFRDSREGIRSVPIGHVMPSDFFL